MKRISISIIHVIGFLLTVLLSIALFSKTAIVGANGEFSKVMALLYFRHADKLRCNAINISNIPQFTGNKEVNYSCDKINCKINVYTVLDHQLVKTFLAIDNSGTSIIGIDSFFSDNKREIISYTTGKSDLSSRIIMNFQGELLQSIDETPGDNRILSFIGYQPDTGMLVYRDEKSNDQYYYSVDSVYFARRKCP